MLAYATVHDAIRKLPAEKDDPFIQNSYFEFAGMAPRPGGGGSGGGGGEGGPSGKGGPMVGGKRRRKREGREAMMLVGPRPEPPPPNHISQIHSILI
jgi:hypothetical protein